MLIMKKDSDFKVFYEKVDQIVKELSPDPAITKITYSGPIIQFDAKSPPLRQAGLEIFFPKYS